MRSSNLLVLIAVLMIAGMATAAEHTHARGKYAAPVDLRFSVSSPLQANTPIEVSVEVVPGVDAGELLLMWIPSAGLMLEPTDNPVRISPAVAGRNYPRSVRLIAAADGEYRLGAVVTLVTGPGRQSRAFSQRLVVGSAAIRRAKPALSRDANGGLIQSMPAQESVTKTPDTRPQ